MNKEEIERRQQALSYSRRLVGLLEVPIARQHSTKELVALCDTIKATLKGTY